MTLHFVTSHHGIHGASPCFSIVSPSELLHNLQSELSDLFLSFHSNDDWDAVTDINARDEDLDFTSHSTRKCKSLQSITLCATMSGQHSPSMKVHLKIGRHKYHRSPFYTSSAYKEMMNEYKAYHRDDDKAMEDMMYDLKTDNKEESELQNMHWTIGHDVLDVAEDEWNDPNTFKAKTVTSHRGKKVIRKCKESFCLCQYVNEKEDGHQKHLCKPALKADSLVVLLSVCTFCEILVDFSGCWSIFVKISKMMRFRGVI